MGGISIIALGNYGAEDIYLLDPYHFGEIIGESITQNCSLNGSIDVFTAHRNSLREPLSPTKHQEF